MNYYQHQKLQHFQQSDYQNSMNLLHQMLFFDHYTFLTDLTVQNKQFFSGKLFIGLRGQLYNSETMYKVKIKLLYNEELLF